MSGAVARGTKFPAHWSKEVSGVGFATARFGPGHPSGAHRRAPRAGRQEVRDVSLRWDSGREAFYGAL